MPPNGGLKVCSSYAILSQEEQGTSKVEADMAKTTSTIRNEHIAVCTVQTVEGTILATRFIGGGAEPAECHIHSTIF